ncbi:hypothetical protein [Elizabethkingia anophelis]|uniref:hypothetical protein n=1 Tax=Elizabethkingia anophelis TaxID=1117645 RepID=UPI000994AD4E|nr:hypothetical protein [Elizabethkingia anophelis]AQW92997.1 hypothetical protein BBD30_01755 [Elizabethkingia anophelis]OPB61057.1 hypothetical protein BAS07_01185 [Elizabethkingia anophelis]HAY3557064.1 hypothetical protein [Elizabethkingia meningoseptica]
MKLSDIISRENYHSIQLYKQGVFWVAYEQSAYSIWEHKGYRVNKKYIKSLKRDVVSLGFPASVLDEIGEIYKQDKLKSSSEYKSYMLSQELNKALFLRWRFNTHTHTHTHTQLCVTYDLVAKIKSFCLSNKTPLEAYLFLYELQSDLNKDMNYGII